MCLRYVADSDDDSSDEDPLKEFREREPTRKKARTSASSQFPHDSGPSRSNTPPRTQTSNGPGGAPKPRPKRNMEGASTTASGSGTTLPAPGTLEHSLQRVEAMRTIYDWGRLVRRIVKEFPHPDPSRRLPSTWPTGTQLSQTMQFKMIVRVSEYHSFLSQLTNTHQQLYHPDHNGQASANWQKITNASTCVLTDKRSTLIF